MRTVAQAVRRSGGRYAAVAGFLALAGPLQAQTGIAERLQDRVSPEVVAAVQRIAREAEVKGLPVEPLVQKAIEGGAKGVPAPRVVAALELLATRLESAAGAARAAGVSAPDAATIEAGAFALGTGIREQDVARLVRASQAPHAPGSSLRVAGALAALGVPSGETVDLLVQVIEAGQPVADVLSLPARVQAGIGSGLSPGEAAGQARGRGRGRHSPPGHGGPPKDKEKPGHKKPPHPPHPPPGRPGGVT
jgi:hypothetical protein